MEVRRWARHSQPFSCSWEFSAVILWDGPGQHNVPWISGNLGSSPPDFPLVARAHLEGTSPFQQEAPGFLGLSMVSVHVIPRSWDPPAPPARPKPSRAQQSTTEPAALPFQHLPAQAKQIPRILEVKVAPATPPWAHSCCQLQIQQDLSWDRCTGNSKSQDHHWECSGHTRSWDLSWRRRRRKADQLFTSRECSWSTWIMGIEAKSQPGTSGLPGKRAQQRLSWNCKA